MDIVVFVFLTNCRGVVLGKKKAPFYIVDRHFQPIMVIHSKPLVVFLRFVIGGIEIQQGIRFVMGFHERLKIPILDDNVLQSILDLWQPLNSRRNWLSAAPKRLPVSAIADSDNIEISGRPLDIRQTAHIQLLQVIEKQFPGIGNPLQIIMEQLVLQFAAVVFDAAIQIDQLAIQIIDHFKRRMLILRKQDPASPAKHLNIPARLFFWEAVQDFFA